jgi:hypothetical protein
MWLLIILVTRLAGSGSGGFVHDTVTRFMCLIAVAMGVQSALRFAGAFGLLALAVGYASYQVRTTESLLSEAGFQTRTPSTQAQLAMYKRMTPYKLERNTFKGKALYSYADTQREVAYIGGDKAYQRYKQLAIQQHQMEVAYSNMLTIGVQQGCLVRYQKCECS